jgi:hypothetical protein
LGVVFGVVLLFFSVDVRVILFKRSLAVHLFGVRTSMAYLFGVPLLRTSLTYLFGVPLWRTSLVHLFGVPLWRTYFDYFSFDVLHISVETILSSTCFTFQLRLFLVRRALQNKAVALYIRLSALSHGRRASC